jgi:hypothetical protein
MIRTWQTISKKIWKKSIEIKTYAGTSLLGGTSEAFLHSKKNFTYIFTSVKWDF